MPTDFRYRLLKILYNADGEIINLRPIFQPEFETETLKRITLSEALRKLHKNSFIWYQDTGSLTVRFADKYNDDVPINAKIKDEGIEEFLRLQKIYEPIPEAKPIPTVNIGRDFTGNLSLGDKAGDQTFLENRPNTQPTNPPIAPQKNIIQLIWKWVTTNPISAGIISGTISLVIGTIILRHYHIL